MKVEVKRLGVLRTGSILMVMYGLLALLFVPFLGISFLSGAIFGHSNAEMAAGIGGGVCMILFMLVIYPLMGFIGGVIFAALYNLVVRMTGGMQLEMDVEPVQPGPTVQGYGPH